MAELTRKRVTVSFAFEVMIDDDMIEMSESDEEVKQLDRALLSSLLRTDGIGLKMLLALQVAHQLDAWDYDMLDALTGYKWDDPAFISACVTPAIEALGGAERSEWKMIGQHDDFNECVEQIIDCFTTKLVESRIEVTTPGKEQE